MAQIVESGLRPGRTEWVRETTFASPPANPAWSFYSDAVQNISWGPGPNISPRRSVGNADVQAFNAGAESGSFDTTFDQQVWFNTGASGDGIIRQSNGCLYSHTVVERVILGTGADGGERRLYTVALGAKINTVSATGEPESGNPITTTLNYLASKVRAYIIDQPGASGTLTVESTNAADTGATFTVLIEDDGAATSESVQLNGTTPVATIASFATVDSVYYTGTGDLQGNIIVKKGANTLSTIYGKLAYQSRAFDRGVPSLGSGSHAATIGTAYENLIGDIIERPGGTGILAGSDVSTFGFTVDNALQAEASHLRVGRNIYEGARTYTVEGSIYGEKAGFEAMSESLRKLEANIVWILTGGTMTFNDAVLTDVGNIARETEQAVMTVDSTFIAKTLTFS